MGWGGLRSRLGKEVGHPLNSPLACVWLKYFIEGSLEVKLPTIWTDEKQRRAEAERRERLEERRSEKRKSQKKKDAGARKAKHCVFLMVCGSGGSKSRLATAAGAEPAGQMRDEKVHAVVARSTFPSQNVQNTPGSDHFWKLRCRKSVRRCGAKHISEVKMLKRLGVRTTFGGSDVVSRGRRKGLCTSSKVSKT